MFNLPRIEIPVELPGELSLGISPPIAAVGRGQVLTLTGNIKLAGMGAPALVLARLLPAGEEFSLEVLATQVKGFGFALPFTGGYTLAVPTANLEYGNYKLQVLALGLPPAPPGPIAVSPEVSMGVEKPRIGAELVEFIAALGASAYESTSQTAPTFLNATATVTNTGNMGQNFGLQLVCAGFSGASTTTGILLPTASVTAPTLSMSLAGIVVGQEYAPGIYLRDGTGNLIKIYPTTIKWNPPPMGTVSVGWALV